MNKETKKKLKQFLEASVYLSLYITIIYGIFMFSFMLFHLTITEIIIYFLILGILIIAATYFMRNDTSNNS
ncbi:MAG: hypothetical protein NV1_29 [Nanoarchaeotal virus 1]|nr:MAG: hypothetical protein NV1_29 [Nanoarchaeotal virus 1]